MLQIVMGKIHASYIAGGIWIKLSRASQSDANKDRAERQKMAEEIEKTSNNSQTLVTSADELAALANYRRTGEPSLEYLKKVHNTPLPFSPIRNQSEQQVLGECLFHCHRKYAAPGSVSPSCSPHRPRR
eukprot:m.172403 g.172403  ORF g.172403 m.172403 type:complete len:129 (-) comp15367_c0_seq7:539-925(-)